MPGPIGDMTPEDAFDPADIDPEATARIFMNIRHNLAPEGHPNFDELSAEEKALYAFVIILLLKRLREEGTG